MASGQVFDNCQLQTQVRQSQKQLPAFGDTFQSPRFGAQGRPSHYGNVIPNNPQPRSVAPFITEPKRFSAPSNTNPNTTDYLDSKDSCKLEEMLNQDNVDDEYKTLILQQIAKLQQQRAEAEKQKLIEKEKKAQKDALAYFEKLEEEKLMLKKKAQREKLLAKEAEEKKFKKLKKNKKPLN